MRITEKPVVPNLTPAQAFAKQRAKEGGSYRLRTEVKALLNEGKASTEVVAEVFELIVRRMGPTGRVHQADVARILKDFNIEQNGGIGSW